MDTTDEPTTLTYLAIAAAGVGGGMAVSSMMSPKPDKPKMPVATGNPKETAPQEAQVSEAARRNRRRQASLLTSSFVPPKLGMPGLLGVSE